MHGHSHAHHDHERKDPALFDEVPASLAIGRERSLSAWGKLLRTPRRKSFQIFFASILVFTPAAFRRRIPAIQDISIFLVIASVLGVYDWGRRTSRNFIQKAKSWQEGLLKHTTPLTREFFFKNENAADRVTLLGVMVNIILSIFKFVAGYFCHSTVLIADAGHSLSDLISDFVTLWAVQIARLPPDDDHPYGHGKFETVGSLFLAMILIGTSLTIGTGSYHRLLEVIAHERSRQSISPLPAPTAPALVMAALSIWSKEWLFRVTRRVGNALNSQVVIANAWHHRSDAFSSILALVSIGFAMAFPSLLWADSGAGILVAGMIGTTGFEIMLESIKELTDTTDHRLVDNIKEMLESSEDVHSVKQVRARRVGSSALVDVAVTTPSGMSVSATRQLEQRLRWKIIEQETSVMDVAVMTEGEGNVVCPLLTAHRGVIGEQRSTAEISAAATGLIVQHPDVLSVQKVTVHFEDTILVNVEAAIRVKESSTISEARQIANTLRGTLLAEGGVHKARIYIDLQDDHSMLDVVPALTPTTS